MIQPPKMSPLPLASAGIGMTRITSWRSPGRLSGAIDEMSGFLASISGIFASISALRPPILSPLATRPVSMRPATLSPPAAVSPSATEKAPKSDWRTLGKLLPYVWQWRWRVGVALACLVAAKLANIGVPLVLKSLVDALALTPGDPKSVLVVPVAILVGSGLLRLSITLFPGLREFLCWPVAARIAGREGQ